MTKRNEQANHLIQEVIGGIISREIELPSSVVIAITKVDTAPNLKQAKIWIAITPEEETGKAYGILRKNIKMLQQELSDKLGMQFSPKIQFRVDKGASALEEVENLLREIKKEDDDK